MNIKILFFIFIPFLSYSQKQGNIWYFAGNGINFNSGFPILLTDGQIPESSNIEGTATISDSTGNLLFYATATTIWNKNHQIMQNGAGLLGGESSTQGVFIVPFPNSNTLFYVFTLDEMQNCFQNGLRYSIVDICLYDGLGAVDYLHKNIFLLDSVGEKLAGTFHSNGTDIWIVVHKYFSDAFYAYRITANGISAPVISHIGSYHPADSTNDCNQAIGQMKISPDGSMLALVNGNPSEQTIAELFDFNNTTGIISNRINLQPDTSLRYYGVSFSPDNSKLYVTKLSGPYEIYQYDLSSGIPATIVASKISIHTTGEPPMAMQLAPDGKIYIVSSIYLDVISFPNNPDLSCGYISPGFNINGTLPYSLPNFIDSYNYKNGIPYCDTCTTFPDAKFNHLGNTLSIQFNDVSGGVMPDNWFWDFGDGTISTEQNPMHSYDTSGVYIVTFIACNISCCDTITDTVRVTDVGIEDFSNLNNSIKLYPNPANNYLIIETTLSGKLNYSVYDITGRQLQSGSFLRNKKLDVMGLAEGVYVIQLQTQKGVISKKFVKN